MLATCLTGERAVGGGAHYEGAAFLAGAVLSSDPRKADGSIPADGEPATAWRAVAANPSGQAHDLIVSVLCVSP